MQAQQRNKHQSVWTADWQDPSQENLRPCDDIFLAQTTSCFSFSHVFMCSELQVLWDVRIIWEAPNKNRSERSPPKQHTAPPDASMLDLSGGSQHAGLNASKQSPDLWPFAAELKQSFSDVREMRVCRTPSLWCHVWLSQKWFKKRNTYCSCSWAFHIWNWIWTPQRNI